AVDLATEVSEPGALTRSLTALGAIEGIRGNFERGLEVKLEGLRIAERGGNLTEIARACISAGVSLHELRRYEESLKYYDRALQARSRKANSSSDCGFSKRAGGCRKRSGSRPCSPRSRPW